MKRKKRLEKGIESIKEQIEIHEKKLAEAMVDGNEDLVTYYHKDIKRLEKQEKKKQDQFDKS